MSVIKITNEQLQLVEKLGVVFDKSGLQPAAARIASLLLVADQVEMTFDEIRKTLNLSKSATSNAINALLKCDRVEYITKTGDRKRYFRSNVTLWKEGIAEKFQEMEAVQNIMREVLAQRPETTKDFNQNLADMISMFEFIFRELPTLYKRWEVEKKQGISHT